MHSPTPHVIPIHQKLFMLELNALLCWAQVELQGVSLVVLSFFRDLDAATELADIVKRAGGIMGAAVCCAENGGDPNDDWTTCDRDRDMLLDR